MLNFCYCIQSNNIIYIYIYIHRNLPTALCVGDLVQLKPYEASLDEVHPTEIQIFYKSIELLFVLTLNQHKVGDWNYGPKNLYQYSLLISFGTF